MFDDAQVMKAILEEEHLKKSERVLSLPEPASEPKEAAITSTINEGGQESSGSFGMMRPAD